VLAIREAALRGFGVAQLPNCYVDVDLRTGELQAVLTDYGVPNRPVYVVFPGNRYIPARTRAFVTFFQRWFRSLPWRDNEPSAAVPILRSRSESEA
jgi:DNA-binding transcriptional LysR family regulator